MAIKRLFLSVMVITLCLTGCKVKQNQVDKETLEAYNEAKSLYPKIQTWFLPDLESGKLQAIKIVYPTGRNYSYIHLVMEYLPEQMDDILFDIFNNYTGEYSFSDEELLILNYDPEKIHHFKNLKTVIDDPDLSPIPNFDFLQNAVDSNGNPRNWEYETKGTIYTFGWTEGKIIDEQFLSGNNFPAPEGWEHGAVKGVVVWDNYVAYWLDVW